LSPLVAVALLGALSPAAAETWLPLDTGFFWSYAGSFAADLLTVEGSVEVLGQPAQSILYFPSTSNEGLRHGQARYTTDETCDLLAYGFPTPVESWSWAGVKSLYH